MKISDGWPASYSDCFHASLLYSQIKLTATFLYLHILYSLKLNRLFNQYWSLCLIIPNSSNVSLWCPLQRITFVAFMTLVIVHNVLRIFLHLYAERELHKRVSCLLHFNFFLFLSWINVLFFLAWQCFNIFFYLLFSDWRNLNFFPAILSHLVYLHFPIT